MIERAVEQQRSGASSPPKVIMRKTCGCGRPMGPSGECTECRKKRMNVQRRRAKRQMEPAAAPQIVHDVLRSAGRPLDNNTRISMESSFGHDFSQVRIHTGTRAAESARTVNALAYTTGQNIVFGAGRFDTESTMGRDLLAHELAHTVQQHGHSHPAEKSLLVSNRGSTVEAEADRAVVDIANQQRPYLSALQPQQIARACTAASICRPAGVATPVEGSAEEFGGGEEDIEARSRARRQRMAPARAVSSGHGGRALQLQNFLNAEAPGRLANIQGVFLDADLSRGIPSDPTTGTGALTMPCADWIADSLPAGSPEPAGMAGATKDCTFVHGELNRQALAFNTTSAATIGGVSREEWRVSTLQLLIHETEHPRFDTATAGRAAPAGITAATCTRARVANELSEIAAVMSEFPTIAQSAAGEASPTGPLHRLMNDWFDQSIHTGGENISGALLQMGCSCDCSDVDAFVIDTFNEVASAGGWSVAEKDAFNLKMRTELIGPVRPLWPL